MSQDQEKSHYPNVPSAPQYPDAYVPSGYSHQAPPPTYEQSQRINPPPYNRQPMQMPVTYGNPNQFQMQQPYNPYGAAAPTATYQSNPYAAAAPGPAYQFNNPYVTQGGAAVVTLDSLAKVQHAPNGSISIPPPPPGCAPTPGQLAAMQGRPVVVKKQKNSFFG